MENNKKQKQCVVYNVMLCTFCKKEVVETELTYTEDAEPAHIKCLDSFNKQWEDRSELIDLIGY
jgi:hypothetical protein